MRIMTPIVSDSSTSYQLKQMPPENQFANKYLKHLLKGDSHSARQLIFDAVEWGFPVKRIYIEVFQWSQREIGYLWETNQINVADEHFSTETTQSIMALLYPYIATTYQNDNKAIVTCVSGELHEIGARMVADYLTMGGWNTYYLGANTPAESLIQKIQTTEPDLICISVTMTHLVTQLMDLVAQIRSQINNSKTKLILGGRPFIVSPDLSYSFPNVDGCMNDVNSLVDFANNVVLQCKLQEKNMELKEVNNKLHNLATTDSLTGILNRREVFNRANIELERAKRENHHFGLVLIDLDNFKEINDTYGHHMGDLTLIELAGLMQSSIRGYDAAGRIGGDEFLVFFSLGTKRQFRVILARLLKKIQDMVLTTDDGISFEPKASMGAVCSPASQHEVIEIKDLLLRADEALYQSKESGGDQFTLIECEGLDK